MKDMIYEFLNNELKRLEAELNNLKKKLSDTQVQKQETKKFIQILNETMDRKYAGFTPYEVTKDEEVKIKELKLKVDTINEDINILERQILELEDRVLEYKTMMEFAYKLENK